MIDLKTNAGPEAPALLKVHEVAAKLGLSESWVRRHENELPAVRLGGSLRFDSALLEAKLLSQALLGKSLGKEKPVRNAMRYQSGRVYTTGKTKIWYGMFREDVLDVNGKLARKQRNVRLGTLAELPTKAHARKELEKRMTLNTKPSVETTLSELFNKWQEVIVPTLKHSTANVYTYSLKSRILPALGKFPIKSLVRFEVQRFLAAKSNLYSRNTLRELRASLSRVLQWAVDCKWLEENPCIGVELPLGTGRTITREVLTPKQVSEISAKLPEPYSTLILFLAITGLRIGEAVGVKWSDFESGFLKVSRRIYEGKADTLKTQKSKRSVPIPVVLMTRLNKLNQGSEWVFSSRNGTPINPHNGLLRHVRPVANDLGIRLSGFHDLRHTFATDLFNSGIHGKAVSELLGHASVAFTLQTYTHPVPEDFRIPLNQRAAQFQI